MIHKEKTCLNDAATMSIKDKEFKTSKLLVYYRLSEYSICNENKRIITFIWNLLGKELSIKILEILF